LSFMAAFRVVMCCCGALAAASALIAWLLIDPKGKSDSSKI
jgi:hypothetical protein